MFGFLMGTQWIAIGGIFATVSVLIYLAFLLWDPYWRIVDGRVAEMAREDELEDVGPGDSSDFGASKEAAKSGASWFSGQNSLNLESQLINAGIHHRGMHRKLSVLRWLLLLVPPLVLGSLWFRGDLPLNWAVLASSLFMLLAYSLPVMWLNRAVKKYHQMLRAALPDFLDLMVVCLDAGLSLQESVKQVGEELRWIHPGFTHEIDLVQHDIDLGSPVDKAIRRFADRSGYDALRTLSSLIREGQRFGTNVSESLSGHADMLRFQREQAAEENAQKASVKIILPTMLFIFPAIFIVLVSPAAFKIQEAFAGQ
ncbi:Type IV fimbrial assembly protein PilC [Rhodopirellula islandica]|uniref:Type IV fimbrial assembly protein PilC n=1 Tax=Rhodopirellula islandica TaxID=595434 RepID=A0A0J1BDX2_RHOIS|nr:type II secretion system F family protein [Rhodopirellula islandica]KLU04823.1 Type IV fimbrial assembly protein PilC [Rhodopirellula islandica]